MNLSNIAPTTSPEPITEVYWIISIILFGGVIVFVAMYIYAFIKGAQTGNVPKILKRKNTQGMKKYVRKLNVNVCKYCGAKIDKDSIFCKNCGNKLK